VNTSGQTISKPDDHADYGTMNHDQMEVFRMIIRSAIVQNPVAQRLGLGSGRCRLA
jgi:hypothetical protein